MRENKESGLMERTSEGTYAGLVARAETRALATEDYEAKIEFHGRDMARLDQEVQDQHAELQAANQMIQDLEAVIDLATRPEKESPRAEPRAPDVVIIDEDTPGVAGGLASVQEACSAISIRGTNKGKPCIRPAEPNQKHATGRHRY